MDWDRVSSEHPIRSHRYFGSVDRHTNDWISFLASFGAVLLTFLAGAEIDPDSLRTHLKASLSM